MISQDEHNFFIESVAPHYEYLIIFLSYLCRDKSLADDIAQDVMEDTLKYLGRVKTYSNIRAYLTDVAKKKYAKHCQKHPEWILIDGMANEIATDEVLEEIITDFETSVELNKMLKLIDEKYSRILILHYLYEISLKEIADILDKNPNTIRAWHKKALAEMKKVATKMKKNTTI